jgi:hypothetical protein
MRPLLLNQGDQRGRDGEWFPLNLTRSGTTAENLAGTAESELRLIECGECVTTPSAP